MQRLVRQRTVVGGQQPGEHGLVMAGLLLAGLCRRVISMLSEVNIPSNPRSPTSLPVSSGLSVLVVHQLTVEAVLLMTTRSMGMAIVTSIERAALLLSDLSISLQTAPAQQGPVNGPLPRKNFPRKNVRTARIRRSANGDKDRANEPTRSRRAGKFWRKVLQYGQLLSPGTREIEGEKRSSRGMYLRGFSPPPSETFFCLSSCPLPRQDQSRIEGV